MTAFPEFPRVSERRPRPPAFPFGFVRPPARVLSAEEVEAAERAGVRFESDELFLRCEACSHREPLTMAAASGTCPGCGSRRRAVYRPVRVTDRYTRELDELQRRVIELDLARSSLSAWAAMKRVAVRRRRREELAASAMLAFYGPAVESDGMGV